MFRYLLMILILIFATIFIFIIYQLRFKITSVWIYTVAISLASMLIFNTYLTSLPIVMYNMNSILGLKVLTFPIEDIGYLLVAVVLLPPLFEKLSNEERINKRKSTKH